MAVIPCSHQVQLIPQAQKGLDTTDEADQAITPQGTGKDPPRTCQTRYRYHFSS